MLYELWISYRYLNSKRKEKFISIISVISILGIAVGVMALIVVLAVMSGFDKQLKDKIIGTNSHLIVEREGGIEDYDFLVERLNSLPGVASSSPFVNGQALIREQDKVIGVVLRGIDPERERQVTNIGKYLETGSLPKDPGTVLVGRELAWRLNLIVGGKISLISAEHPKPKEFIISGIFNSGMFDYDMNLVFSNLASSQEFYGVNGLAGGIGIRLHDVDRVDEVKNIIQETIGYSYWVSSWKDLNKNLFSALQLEKITMFIILALIVLVACFNIVSTLIMMVMEKTKDIGILKAIGSKSSSIRKIFVFNGFFIGLAGTVLGGSCGVLLCVLLGTYGFVKLPRDIYYIDKLPVNLNPMDIFTVVSIAILISLVSTLYPAYQASRMQPVEALRYE
ncbi:MAG: lipoprotein-releasing ABC transporter permease subunit [Candidatus Omnitrophota bacterium]